MKISTAIPCAIIVSLSFLMSNIALADSDNNGVVHKTIDASDTLIKDTVKGTGKAVKDTGQYIGDTVTDSD